MQTRALGANWEYTKQAMTKPFTWLLSLSFLLPLSCAAPAARVPTPAECSSVGPTESPLRDPSRIADMQVLTQRGRRGNVLGDKKQGVAIAMRPERGLTAEWLSHVLACDRSQPTSEQATSPLALPGANVTVDSVQGQLIIYVRYSDPKIVRRAVELVDQFHAARG
jgi:hypothetical protein